MSIFGKKEAEEEIEEEFENSRKITKNLKDLKPENKKKRKEPPKPWGKKERFIILIVLLITTIISATLLFRHDIKFEKGEKTHFMPNIDFSSLNIFKGETIVIEKEK